MDKVIGRKRYNTEKSQIIASDAYWDGHNWERRGRNTYLYKTQKGNYFVTHLTCWQGEQDHLKPLSQEEAINLWELLSEDKMNFKEAFPGVAIEEA